MSRKTFLIDAHVHLYPQYDLARAYRLGTQNLLNAFRKCHHAEPEQAVLFWLLTERADCDIRGALLTDPDRLGEDVLIHATGKGGAVRVKQDGTPDLYILPGRQAVSSEGLEILALCTDARFRDRVLCTSDLIIAVREAGGIPVLNWAPGKWFSSRGRIVQNLIDETDGPPGFLVGDTPLRHVLWPRPALMRAALKKGFRVIAGSDPLPFPGEERMIGSYGVAAEGMFDASEPAASLKTLLFRDPGPPPRVIGWRNDPLTFAWREWRILKAK
ncbi:MAG TPA: hypothetical protein ENN17_01785 [bacterium]|nr:hypothetical protein [bacterium]